MAFVLFCQRLLSVSAVCKNKAGLNAENSYTGCEVEILIPELSN